MLPRPGLNITIEQNWKKSGGEEEEERRDETVLIVATKFGDT